VDASTQHEAGAEQVPSDEELEARMEELKTLPPQLVPLPPPDVEELLEEAMGQEIGLPPRVDLVASRRQHHGRKRTVDSALRRTVREATDIYLSLSGDALPHLLYSSLVAALREASVDPEARLVDPQDSSRGALLDKQQAKLTDFQRRQDRGKPRPMEPVVGKVGGEEQIYARFSLWDGDSDDPKGDGAGHFIPELYAHLANYSSFRKRTYELLLVLKGRALAWARERDIPDQVILPAMPVCVAFAMDLSEVEGVAVQHLRGELCGVAISTTGRMANGNLHVKKPKVGLDQWKRSEASLLEVVRSHLPVWIGPRTVLPSA